MTPSTITHTSQPTTSTDILQVRTSERTPRPTMDTVMDCLDSLGYPPEETGILLGVLANLAKKPNLRRAKKGRPVVINMDMTAHHLLDAVMPDRTEAPPDSIHEMLNRRFLPEGYTFVHDRRAYCTVEIVRQG